MRTKEDFISALKKNELYAKAIATAKTQAERDRIATLAEAFVARFAAVLAPMIQQAQDDPAYRKKLQESLTTASSVVTSGSVG